MPPDSSGGTAGEGILPTLSSLISDISQVIQDANYTDAILTSRINTLVGRIAGGQRMPDGIISPPLPDLFDMDTVATVEDTAYASLPSDYQRGLFRVMDSSGDIIHPPSGGDYYSFQLFLRSLTEPDMTETGSVYRVCARGTRLYYQGIPSTTENLTVYFYRKPTDMSLEDPTPEPDGIPEHLATPLIKHGVCREIFGEGIEDGVNSEGAGYSYHAKRFYEAMTDLIDHIGIDAQPEYYGGGGYVDPCFDG